MGRLLFLVAAGVAALAGLDGGVRLPGLPATDIAKADIAVAFAAPVPQVRTVAAS